MARAAKFYGHCQACGKKHKLPSGVLAKHGYKVVWNSFWNVCPGAGRSAFEENIDLVKELIKSVTAQRDLLVHDQAAVAGENFVVLTGYGEKDRYFRREKLSKNVLISEVRIDGSRLMWNDPEDGNRPYSFESYRHYELEPLVEAVKENRRMGFESEIWSAEGYVKWQKSRIEGWEPTGLEPIVEKEGPKRKWFNNTKDAYGYERELKAKGHKVRSRVDRGYGLGRGCTVYDYGVKA